MEAFDAGDDADGLLVLDVAPPPRSLLDDDELEGTLLQVTPPEDRARVEDTFPVTTVALNFMMDDPAAPHAPACPPPPSTLISQSILGRGAGQLFTLDHSCLLLSKSLHPFLTRTLDPVERMFLLESLVPPLSDVDRTSLKKCHW